MNSSRALIFLLEVILWINLTNGKIEICLKFDSQYDLQESADTKEMFTLLEKAASELKTTIQQFKLQSARSFNYTYFHLNMSHPAITLEGDLTNGSVIIDDQTILKLFTRSSEGLQIFNFTLPYIYINGSYDLYGFVGSPRLFDIYGNGDFFIQLTNFSVAAVTGLKINSSSLCIPIAVNLYVEDCKSNFINFMNGDVDLEPLLNGAMQAIIPEAIRIIFREDADAIDPSIQWIINNIFNLTTLEHLSRFLYVLSGNTNELKSVLEASEKPINLL